jgi:hypothetical protein
VYGRLERIYEHETGAFHEPPKRDDIEKINVLVINCIKLSVQNHISLTGLYVKLGARSHHRGCALQKRQRVTVMSKYVLSAEYIKSSTRLECFEISQMDLVFFRAHGEQILGRIHPPRVATTRLEHVKLGTIVASDVEHAVHRSSARKVCEPLHVPTKGGARATHVQIVLEHERGFDEVIELQVVARGTQIDRKGPRVLVFGRCPFKIICERLAAEIDARDEARASTC